LEAQFCERFVVNPCFIRGSFSKILGQCGAGRRIEFLSQLIVLAEALPERKFLLNPWPPEFMLDP